MKKLILSIFITICMAVAIMPIMPTASALAADCTCPAKCTDSYTDPDCPVCNSGGTCESRRDRRIYDDGTGITTQFHLQAALDWKDAAHDLWYFPLDADITVTSNIIVPGNADFVLDLNGHTLSGGDVWAIFKVYGKLTIIDTKGGGKLVDAQGAIKIAGGYVLMKGGTIENCTISGGVLVQQGGTFQMTGGTLKNNTAYVGFWSNAEEYPASICCDSGGGTVVIDGDAQVLCCDQDNCSHFGAVCKATTLYADGGKIKGGIYNDFISDSGIVTGTITSHHTGIGEETVIEGKVLNYGTVSGGTCLGKVENKEGGTISDGSFESKVTNNGLVNGGTFDAEVDNQAKGTISGGTFSENSVVKNAGTISGGTFASEVENQDGGTISDGSFAGKVTNAGTIKGGTFHSEVDNQGTIFGGTYSETSVVKNTGTITGGTFLGTVESENGTIADSAKVSVRFITETGETLKTVRVLRGQRLALTDLPEIDPTQYGYAKVKYTVGGKEYRDNSEFTDAVRYTEDETVVTVTLISPKKYTITYNLNGGSVSSSNLFDANPTEYFSTSEDITLVNPTKDGYTFTGWSGTDLEGTNNMTVTIPKGSIGDRTYTANYLRSPIEDLVSPNYFYTVVYDTQGGSPVAPKTVGLGDISKVEVLEGVKDPTKAGYRFMWWECGGQQIRLANTTVEKLRDKADKGVITLTAVWSEKETVTFYTFAQKYTYDGTAKAFEIKASPNTDTPFVIVYRQNGNTVAAPTDAGSYDVIITRAEDKTYKAVNVTIPNGLVIKPKAVTATISEISDQTYTGKEIEPAITVSVGTKEIPSSDYTVEYADNRNAGTATVTVTARAGGNYTFTQPQTFTINKKSITPTITMADYVYGTAPDYPVVSGNEGGGAVKIYYGTHNDIDINTESRQLWDVADINGTKLDVGTYYMLVEVAATQNYKAGTSWVSTFEVKPNKYETPAAPTLNGATVTINEADRNKDLVYSLNGGAWTDVPQLDTNGSFVLPEQYENSGYTIALRQQASVDGNYEESDAVSCFSVAYNANDGTSTAPAFAFAKVGENIAVATGDGLQRKGYTFIGWNTKADGTGTAYNAGSSLDTATTLYAQWTINRYTITLDANGGTVETTALTTGDGWKLTEELPVPTRNGYTFNGWYTATENGEMVTADTLFNANTTIYAQWKVDTYKVNLDTNGGTIEEGNVTEYTYGIGATLPTKVKRSGYSFAGWYDNKECTGSPVTAISDTAVGEKSYWAKWTRNSSSNNPTYPPTVEQPKDGNVIISTNNPTAGSKVTITPKPDEGHKVDKITVTDQNGNPVEVIDNGDGTYSYIQPVGKVDIEVIFVEANDEQGGFVDVFPEDYYYDAVYWAVENGITTGVDDTHFSPNADCTRAQAVTFLWRAAGSPQANATNQFVDVPVDSYYAEAVAWALAKGITTGVDDTHFAPNATCDRSQIVTLLWRLAGSPKADNISGFVDVPADSYYAQAVEWAVAEGITTGTDATHFIPDDDCTRGQIVTFLFRALS